MSKPLYLDYQDDDMYKQPCQECGTILGIDVSIEIYEHQTDQENNEDIVVCDDCSQTYENEYKSKGYIGQGELDEIWFNENSK